MGSAVTNPIDSTSSLQPLVEAMRRPHFYPEPTETVELRQTHISCVFLVDDYVYKVKRPVNFAFIDCRDLSQRYRFCAEEIRLNSRLSPLTYLGVWAIYRRDGNYILGNKVDNPDLDATEYAVKMRRLPAGRMLDRLVSSNAVDANSIFAIASKIAAFHANASDEQGWRYGCAAAIAREIDAELEENRAFVSDTLTAGQYSQIAAFFHFFVEKHTQQLDQRARRGRVKEGHGDLRAEHVCIQGDRIEVIDCVEFNERLRYGDVASEIAFLTMDLDRLGDRFLADELIAAYMDKAADVELAGLIPFYKCYRACVRAKVDSLRSRQLEIDATDRDDARQRASDYFALATAYAILATPALIIVCGLSGTGKSTVARRLRIRTGFDHLNSDEVRKRLAGIPPTARAHSDYSSGLYSEHFNRMTYDELLRETEDSLQGGRGVILDATFKLREDRESVMKLSTRLRMPALFIECVADKEEVVRRLDRREALDDDVSDATRAVYEKQIREFEPLTEIPTPNHIVMDTSHDHTKTIDEAIAALSRLVGR